MEHWVFNGVPALGEQTKILVFINRCDGTDCWCLLRGVSVSTKQSTAMKSTEGEPE